jgi:flavin-dependent dehydrogenase
MAEHFDVVVIGGGPAGSLCAALLRRYTPTMRVALVEQAAFPRYHIGESLVLEVNRVLQDAGVLEKVEKAGFLRKCGATYVWGIDRRPWPFLFTESTGRRPHFDGMQNYTWHVERAAFDQLLLDHARDLGVEVHQPATVTEVLFSGERATGVRVEHNGTTLQFDSRFVVDASGRAGVLAHRIGERAFDSIIRNMAVFGYWQDADCDPEYTVGWDPAAIAVVSAPEGWVWYIPIRPGLVSVGYVTPAATFKKREKDDLEVYYRKALQDVPEIEKWLRNAALIHHEHAPARVMAERDFNYLHSRWWGPGYALVGDAGGFLDPLFTFGVFMAATGAQLAAYAIGTLLDERAVGATEELVLGGYEQHMRTYYGAFAAMLYVFYRSNTDRSAYWHTARDLIQRESLPPNITDREAFMALTFGYGVNTYVFHEATQHFGQVALRRIFDMGNSADAPIAWSDPGEFGGQSLDDDSRPVLLKAPAIKETVIPIHGTGRMIPMRRLEFATSDSGGFPRHIYAPDWLSEMVCSLDGARSVRQLAASLPPGRIRFGANKLERSDVLRKTLRMLYSLGVLGTHETLETISGTGAAPSNGGAAVTVSGAQLPEFLGRPRLGLLRVEVDPPPHSWLPLKPALLQFARWYRERGAEPPMFKDVPLCLFGSEWPVFKNGSPTTPARERCTACQERRLCGFGSELLATSDAEILQRWRDYSTAFRRVTGNDLAAQSTALVEQIVSLYRGPVSLDPSVLVSSAVEPTLRFVVFPNHVGNGAAAELQYSEVLAGAERLLNAIGSAGAGALVHRLGELPPSPVPVGLDGLTDGSWRLKLYLRLEEKSVVEKQAILDAFARFASGMDPVPAADLEMLGLVLDRSGLHTVKAYLAARPTRGGNAAFPPPLPADHPLVRLTGDRALATLDVWCRGARRANKWDFNLREHYLAGAVAERLVAELAYRQSAAQLRPLLVGPTYRADLYAVGVRAGTLALYMELN